MFNKFSSDDVKDNELVPPLYIVKERKGNALKIYFKNPLSEIKFWFEFKPFFPPYWLIMSSPSLSVKRHKKQLIIYQTHKRYIN